MAVTITTMRTEVLTELQDTSSVVHTDAAFIADTNRFYSRYGRKIKLQGRTTYTWSTATTSVALSTINSALVQIEKIHVLNSDDDVTGELAVRPKGADDGIYIWNDTIYLNPNGEAPTEALSLVFYYFRNPTTATATSNNIDVHDGYERSVMHPWYMAQCYRRLRKPATADGYMAEFNEAFRMMMRDRGAQFNPDHDTIHVSDAYSSLTG